MVTINIAHLKPGIHSYALDPSADELELDPEVFRDVHVDVRLDYSGERILATLSASAIARLECDRTLQLFDQPVQGSYVVLFAPPDVVEHGEVEQAPDIRVLHPTDLEIDLTSPIRDTLVLALPTRRIAPGAEDLEIPTSFGSPAEEGGDAIDPRWEALRKLRSNDDA